jgi:hypothetical protein
MAAFRAVKEDGAMGSSEVLRRFFDKARGAKSKSGYQFVRAKQG